MVKFVGLAMEHEFDGDYGEITELLRVWGKGDRSVEDRLFALVAPDLLRRARGLIQRERSEFTLQASDLFNETYVRLVKASQRDWQSRREFYGLAARIMRNVIVDHVRHRPKAARVPIEDLEGLLEGRDALMELALSIDPLLDQLAVEHPEWCTIVELKFYSGLTNEEVCEVLHLSLKTMERRWGDARRWLFRRLKNKDAG
jgi:RNA polymerase sigma-70 factor, ECF subfamily